MIPDNVEKIIMTKEDYDRNVEQLLVEKLELEQELQRKDNIIKDIKEYVNYLVIFNQTINGKFNETQWGQDILGLIEELENEKD